MQAKKSHTIYSHRPKYIIFSLALLPIKKPNGKKTIMERPLKTFAYLLSLLLLHFDQGGAAYYGALHINADPYYCDWDKWETVQEI